MTNVEQQKELEYERAKFSLHTNRFEINIEKRAQLPITILKQPETLSDGREERGVFICGDSVIDDIVRYAPKIKKRWFIVTTTQSHVVPISPNPDLHIFSNCDGKAEYLASTARDVPFLNVGDGGDFVNPDIFYPNEKFPKYIDSIYVAKWSDTKRVELFIQAAKILPHRKFVFVAIPMSSERKKAKSLEYRDAILHYVKEHRINNIKLIETDEKSHLNPDGSLVPGNLSKDEMRLLFQSTKSIVLTADKMEGINRSVAECLCCDVPVVMTIDVVGGSPYVVNAETGVLVDPNDTAVASGIEHVINNKHQFHPRKNFLKTRGIYNANRDLQSAIAKISKLQNYSSIDTSKMKLYGGDLWTPFEAYSSIFDL
jgi:glycosyltransferase involved in cell wall biosynthesis